jgi:hypothetical protein
MASLARAPALASLVLALLAVVSCDRASPALVASGGAQAAAAALTVEVEPALGHVPRVARFRARAGSGDALAPGDLVLVRGQVGPAQLKQLAAGEPSRALAERIVPSVVWADAGALVLQPSVPLEAGAAYALASGAAMVAASVVVAGDDDAPILPRVWPPAGGSGSPAFAVWCGAEALAPFAADASLEPGGVRGRLRRGAVGDELGRACVRFEPAGDAAPPAGELAPPPAVELAGTTVLLDPRPLADDGAAASPAPRACEAREVAFGPGCATVEDDRLSVRAPGEPLLWAISGEGLDRVLATEADASFELGPLPPERAIVLDVGTMDVAGGSVLSTFLATTGPPRAHLVINEVLADPLGPEPQQEWVEIYDDGLAPASLGVFAFCDTGGCETLPGGTLEPGRYALLVNDDFVEDDGIDIPPAAGTLLVRLRHLGAGGLKNDGEPVRLIGPRGQVVSAVPSGVRPKPGRSVARVRPGAPDGAAGAFVVAEPTPGRGNGL